MRSKKSFQAFAGSNLRSVRRANRSMIFRALHALGPIARADLARSSGLNPGTVTIIIDELLRFGLVEELEQTDIAGNSRVGRRPVALQVRPDAKYAVGIDLARSHVSGAIINLAGEAVIEVTEPTVALVSDAAIDQIAHVANQLIDMSSEEIQVNIVGVGVGAPGALSFRQGRFQPPPSYGDWEAIDLRHALESRIGRNVVIDNNANTAALGELWFGAGAGVQNFVLLNLGTGVGAGLVLDGNLYRGEHDLAAEIGHMSIQMDGPRCACGNTGCLELYVSVPRVLNAAQAALDAGEPSLLEQWLKESGTKLSIAMLREAALAEDPLAQRILADVAKYLAAGIVNIINMLDPDVVFVGRDMVEFGDLLLDPVRLEVSNRVLPVLRPSVNIEAATLENAPVVGAAVLAMQSFFESPVEGTSLTNAK